ncbi:MAG: LysR family transcriptional regulator [Eubacteriales bacterium]|jgi:DNA-binding transcriptional LysR family regulator
MEIETLNAFLTIVREESISSAASVLHVTQPALSRRMQRLEQELDAKLFERGRKITLTPAGQMLKERAEEIVSLVERTESDFRSADKACGTISIGSGGLSANIFLSEVMEKFRAENPEVNYQIYVNSAEYVKDMIDRGLLDFGLLLQPVDVTRYDFIELRESERTGLFIRRDHPAAKKGFVTAEDIASIPLIIPSRESVRNDMENRIGIPFSKMDIFASNNLCTNSIIFVKRGTAALLTIEGAVTDYLDDTMIFLPMRPEISANTVFVWKKGALSYGATGKFLEFFRKEVRDYRHGIS